MSLDAEMKFAMHRRTESDARDVRSAFNWNFGGWWGATFGAVAWMLFVAGCASTTADWKVAAIVLASAAILVALATWLWSKRHSLSAFQGLMTLMIAAAIVLPATYYTVGHFASAELLAKMHWSNSTIANIVIIGIVPATILRLWYAERAAKLKN